MPIPSKVSFGGNSSSQRNIFRITWSTALSVAPQYQMWDNSSTFPAVDASGSTVVKEAFVGTSGNSNKPEYALACTSSLGTTNPWMPTSATAGSANPNRMKGTTNYVNDPTTPGAGQTTTFNITAEFASDAAVPSSSSQNILLQVQYQYTGTAPTLTYAYNDAAATGTESSPVWQNFTPGTHGIRLVNTGTTAGTYKFTLPASSTSTVNEIWVTV
jgi:hypothetical protein